MVGIDSEAVVPQRQPRVSAASVARAAGVSPAAVSYVFNDRPGVSAETRALVRDAAKSLGFTPSRPTAPVRAHIVGLILSNVANPFYPELSVGFSEAARSRGYQVFLSHTDDDQESLTQSIAAMLDRSVDGIAVAVARSDNASAVRQMRRAHVPMVQISRTFQHVDADFVGIDDRGAAVAMMRHALAHHRWPIATVIGPRASSASAEREAGFVSAARDAGIVIPGPMRVSVPLTLQGGRAAAEHLFSLPQPPRFVLCGSDILAFGVMSHALELGLRIPEDVALSGFDGIEMASTPMIDLTGIVQPRRAMSATALELLADRIEHGQHSTMQRHVRHTIRVGRTCGCTSKGRSDS
ncbi:LacI family DNA-binding transcriptional regulator [Microbacteriaceae bacterium VKM Ac-2855]|nr:LacI family DNA-binding transcriptional regulator [Microbacteriaceae bacterium VKM Ac-2855]